nr:metallophosphoesterase family protein [Desulfobacterales bacterium]
MTDQRLPGRASPCDRQTVGVISDTHGRLHPSALKTLKGCSLTLHAGDVGKAEVLRQLETVAPVIAVRGNVDRGVWAESLPVSKTLDISGFRIHLLHRLEDLDFDPLAEGTSA